MKYSEYQPRPDLLKDRIILITGAGDGIGRAAAMSYALHGATVVLHGRTPNLRFYPYNFQRHQATTMNF